MKKTILLIGLSAALTMVAGAAPASIDEIIGVGDEAPGAPTNTIRIRSFGTPSGWQNGFMVNITATDGITRVTSITDLPNTRTATVLIKSGDAVPGHTNLLIQRFWDPVPDASGAAAVRAVIKRFTATNLVNYVNGTNDNVLLLVSPVATPQYIIREGDSVPAMSGYIVASFRTLAMRRQDIHLLVMAYNPSTGGRVPALLKYDHATSSLRNLAYVGQQRTYRGGTVIVDNLSVSPVSGSTGDGQSGGEYYLLQPTNIGPIAEDTAFSLPIMILRPLPTHPDYGIHARFRVLALEK